MHREKIKLIGYSYCNILQPRHWFLFANGTAITTATVEGNKALLNVFTKWYRLAKFKVRVSKFLTFGIKKTGKTAKHF